MKILVAGFDACGGETVNPSIEAVRSLPMLVGGAFTVKLEIPTIFFKSMEVVANAIEELDPDAVICVAQAGGRSVVTPEFVAINYMDADVADNAGNKPHKKAIVPDGPAAYFSTLPLDEIVSAMCKSGVPAAVSYTAGTTIPNSLMYGISHFLKQNRRKAAFGMIHVPFLPAQTVSLAHPVPSMSLADIKTAVEAAVGAIAHYLNNETA